ncbi:MAG TPA: WD40 repeat domain-containing serine/threonine protein kinase [Kofleriaceae bacterium]
MVASASGGRMWGSCESDQSATRTAIEVESAGQPALPPPPHRLSAPLQCRDPDRYELLGEHGRGGLGTVTRAHDKELGRNVAIKELIKRGDAGEIRFLREAMITARLEHPGIVPVHEAGQWPDGTPFYVMKLVAGRSLKEVIAKCTSIADRMALLHHVVAVADAVAYAHKRKIIHRDLKPANVIVGDFGETVVIDWGLAKDLSELDETGLPDDRSPYRAGVLDDLTKDGSVLGTPMYMAPEQWRGERVDQRADVFAIGAMLWELCSKHRVPPAESRARDKHLRRTNIDADLIAIIGKALSSDPADRYQNAGELASDLRAFTSGARIASRRYSLAGVAVHWIRHHRAIAAIAAAAVVLGVIGATMYVRNITTERTRAELANEELVLQNAALLMQRDPSAVIDALAGYRGKDTVRKDRLVAEARGRGVAEARFKPHSDTIFFVHREPDGSVYSLGQDHRVVVTRNGVSTTVASDVSAGEVHGYARGLPLIAYAAAPTGIVLRNVVTGVAKRFGTRSARNLALSADGALLAALDMRGKLSVWNTSSSKLLHESSPGGEVVEFSGSLLIVKTATGLQTIALSADAATTITDKSVAAASFHGEGGLVATGDDKGRVTLRDHLLEPIVELDACREAVVSIRVVARSKLVVFGCNERTAGVARYDVENKTLTVEFSTRLKNRPMLADTDAEGRRLFVLVDPSTVVVADLKTRITRTYEGHAGFITAVSIARDATRLVTADLEGTVRVWKLDTTASRVVLTAPAIFTPTPSLDGRHVFVDGGEGIVRRIDLTSGAVAELKGHTAPVIRIRAASDGQSILSVAQDGTVRVWDPRTTASLRVFDGHHGAVVEAEYLKRGDRIASGGSDGRVLVWTTRGTDASVLFTCPSPVITLETLAASNRVVVADSTNAVFEVALDGTARLIVDASSDTITLLRASLDGTRIAIGRASGAVTIYETSAQRIVSEVKLASSIHQMQFDPQNRDLAIQTDDGAVRIVALEGQRFSWRELAGRARDVSYSPDGETLAIVGSDGNWFYTTRDRRWSSAPDHAAQAIAGRFTTDGKHFVSTDFSGSVVARDLSHQGPN